MLQNKGLKGKSTTLSSKIARAITVPINLNNASILCASLEFEKTCPVLDTERIFGSIGDGNN